MTLNPFVKREPSRDTPKRKQEVKSNWLFGAKITAERFDSAARARSDSGGGGRSRRPRAAGRPAPGAAPSSKSWGGNANSLFPSCFCVLCSPPASWASWHLSLTCMAQGFRQAWVLFQDLPLLGGLRQAINLSVPSVSHLSNEKSAPTRHLI